MVDFLFFAVIENIDYKREPYTNSYTISTLLGVDKNPKLHVHGILKDAMTKFKSMEGGAKYKYEKIMEVRDLILNDRKELKAKIQVTVMNPYSQPFFVCPLDLSENS